MTEKLYDEDSFVKKFDAVVLECEKYHNNWAVVLDKTAFFPEGGGQQSDIGTIDNAAVSDVQITDDIIYHITDTPLPVGATVTGVIDFSRRFDFMQQHSGEHIVSGVAHSLFGCENVGFHLGADIVTLDFDKFLNKEQILKIETEANKKVFENVKFFTYYPDENTLKSLNYRSKKELQGAIRIVEIENTDICACCAPHIKTAGEIGLIKLSGGEKLRGGIRLEIKCGNRALKDYNEKQENISAISAALCVKQSEAFIGVDRLLKQVGELKSELTSLKRQIIENKVSAFNPKSDLTAEFENGLEIKNLQHYADALYKKSGGIRAVFSGAENGFAFAVCGDEYKLQNWFKAFKESFAVKGGGRGTMVQGTVKADKAQLSALFNSEL